MGVAAGAGVWLSQISKSWSIFPRMRVLVVLCSLVYLSSALPTLYNVDEDSNADPVLIPVSSTVIPLEDLPELQVGFGFGLVEKDKVKKPPFYLKDIKLITSKNKHRFVAKGGVQQLTKEEFEAFNLARR